MTTKEILKDIDMELKSLERSIVATPEDREYLDEFAKANGGSMDAVLAQMAVQYGYALALKRIKENIDGK